MTEHLTALGVIDIGNGSVRPGPGLQAFLDTIGLDFRSIGSVQPLAKLCLDWTERRHHLSGPLAKAILHKSFEMNWLERRVGSRALTITPNGLDAFERCFGIGRNDMLAR